MPRPDFTSRTDVDIIAQSLDDLRVKPYWDEYKNVFQSNYLIVGGSVTVFSKSGIYELLGGSISFANVPLGSEYYIVDFMINGNHVFNLVLPLRNNQIYRNTQNYLIATHYGIVAGRIYIYIRPNIYINGLCEIKIRTISGGNSNASTVISFGENK